MNRRPSPSAAWAAELLPKAAVVLVLAAGAEFLLLRVLNRMADRVPGLRGPGATGLLYAGTAALNLAFLLGIVAVLMGAFLLWERERRIAGLAVAWVAALLLAASGSALASLAATSLLAVLLAILVARSLRRLPLRDWRRALAPALFLGLMVAAVLAALYWRGGDAAAALGFGPPARTSVFALGEVFAVAAALAAAFAFRGPWTKWNVLLPAATGLACGAFVALRPDLAPLIAFLSVGFQMSLPAPIYVLAAAAFAYAVVNLKRAGRYRFLGFLLLALGGRMLTDSYGMVLVGAAVLFLTLDEELPWRWSVLRGNPRPSEVVAVAAGEAPGPPAVMTVR